MRNSLNKDGKSEEKFLAFWVASSPRVPKFWNAGVFYNSKELFAFEPLTNAMDLRYNNRKLRVVFLRGFEAKEVYNGNRKIIPRM